LAWPFAPCRRVRGARPQPRPAHIGLALGRQCDLPGTGASTSSLSSFEGQGVADLVAGFRSDRAERDEQVGRGRSPRSAEWVALAGTHAEVAGWWMVAGFTARLVVKSGLLSDAPAPTGTGSHPLA
jgi:hypothetical protein